MVFRPWLLLLKCSIGRKTNECLESSSFLKEDASAMRPQPGPKCDDGQGSIAVSGRSFLRILRHPMLEKKKDKDEDIAKD